MKYKQTYIPSIKTPKRLLEAKNKMEVKNYIKDFYKKKLRNKSVINKSLGYTINFTSRGLNKITHGGAFYFKKAVATLIIDKILTYAEYSNFGQPKKDEHNDLVGYLNFKAKVKIDGNIEYLRIATILYKKNMKNYYNHEINLYTPTKKQKPKRPL